jgi:outer membrane protein assembly factor BamB
MWGDCLLKKSLAVGIIFLFIFTSVTPMVVGFDNPKTSEDELIKQIEFAYADRFGSNADVYIERYFEQMNSQTDEETVDNIGVSNQNVLSTPTSTSNGLMDSPWPMKCHDTHHTSRSEYSTADNPFIEKWRFDSDWVEGSPVIDNNGIIYFGDFDRDLYAVYPNGTVKWKYHTGGWIWSAPAINKDGTIYCGSYDCKLYAMNQNGTLKWKFSTGGSIGSSPVISNDGTIYFGTLRGMDKGDIFAVNPDGSEKWRYETGYYIGSDPTITNDGIIYIGSGDSYLYAMNPDGTLKWRYKTGDEVHGHPSIAQDGTVYVGSNDKYLHAVHPNGTMKWKFNIKMGTSSNPAIGEDGTIYIGTDKLYAINPDGTEKWSFNLGGDRSIHHSSPAIDSEGTIFVGINIDSASGGELIAVNSNGAERWRSRKICTNWIYSSPCIGSNGTVYIGISNRLDAEVQGGFVAFGKLDLNAPEPPLIYGNYNGKPKVEYEYTFSAIDPNDDDVYYYIEWGDGKKTDWSGPYNSSEEVTFSHTWNKQGNYTIRTRAKDVHNLWGNWATLEVSMPKNKSINTPFLNFLENHPRMFPLLRQLLGL